MGMTREQVFGLVDAERLYQDRAFNPELETSCGQTRRQRDLNPAPGVLMLEEYIEKARQAWIKPTLKADNIECLQNVAKVAAIAVRILERAGGSERLLRAGLR